MRHTLWVTRHPSCWSLLSTLDRCGDGDCLFDCEFSLVTGHTFLASIGSHVVRNFYSASSSVLANF